MQKQLITGEHGNPLSLSIERDRRKILQIETWEMFTGLGEIFKHFPPYGDMGSFFLSQWNEITKMFTDKEYICKLSHSISLTIE